MAPEAQKPADLRVRPVLLPDEVRGQRLDAQKALNVLMEIGIGLGKAFEHSESISENLINYAIKHSESLTAATTLKKPDGTSILSLKFEIEGGKV